MACMDCHGLGVHELPWRSWIAMLHRIMTRGDILSSSFWLYCFLPILPLLSSPPTPPPPPPPSPSPPLFHIPYTLSFTLGKEKYWFLSSFYYNGAQAFPVVYSTIDPDSFEEVEQYWINEIFAFFDEEAIHQMPIIVVGTKLGEAEEYFDDEEIVKPCDVKHLREKCENLIGSIECSAKTGKGVDKVFNTLAREIFDHVLEQSKMDRINVGVDPPRKRCNCRK